MATNVAIYPGAQWKIVGGSSYQQTCFPIGSIWTVVGRFDRTSWRLTGERDGVFACWDNDSPYFTDSRLAKRLGAAPATSEETRLPIGTIIKDPKLLRAGMHLKWTHFNGFGFILLERRGSGWLGWGLTDEKFLGEGEPAFDDYNFPAYKVELLGYEDPNKYLANLPDKYKMKPAAPVNEAPKPKPVCAPDCTPLKPCMTAEVCPQLREQDTAVLMKRTHFHTREDLLLADRKEARLWRQDCASYSPTGYGGLVGRFRYRRG